MYQYFTQHDNMISYQYAITTNVKFQLVVMVYNYILMFQHFLGNVGFMNMLTVNSAFYRGNMTGFTLLIDIIDI